MSHRLAFILAVFFSIASLPSEGPLRSEEMFVSPDKISNAALVYWQAFAALPSINNAESQRLEEVLENKRPLADVAELAKRAKPSVQLASLITGETPCRWEFVKVGLDAQTPDVTKTLLLAKLILIQAKMEWESGRTESFVDQFTSAMVLARNTDNGYLLSMLASDAIDKMAAATIEKILPELSPVVAQELAAEIVSLPPRAGIATAIEHERDAKIQMFALPSGDKDSQKQSFLDFAKGEMGKVQSEKLSELYDRAIKACRLPPEDAMEELFLLDRETNSSTDPFVKQSGVVFRKFYMQHHAVEKRVNQLIAKLQER